MKNLFILSFFVVSGAVLMPIQQAHAVSAQSSSAEIWAAVQDAVNAGWSDSQIAAAADELGISQSQIQAASISAGGDAKISDRIEEAFAVAEKYPEPSEPPVKLPPPPPQQEESIILTSVYNGVTFETDNVTGNTTVAGSKESMGHFDRSSGLYTDNSGGQVNIAELTRLAVSGTNAGGTVTTVVDGHSYEYQNAMWNAGYNFLQALATKDTAGMAAAVEAANLAVRTEAGDALPDPVAISNVDVNRNPSGALESLVVGNDKYVVISGNVYSPGGTIVGTYDSKNGTISVTDSRAVFGRDFQTVNSSTIGIYNLDSGMFTPTQQTGVSYYYGADGAIHYGCTNSQNSTLTFPAPATTPTPAPGGSGPGTQPGTTPVGGPTDGTPPGGPGGGPGGGGPVGGGPSDGGSGGGALETSGGATSNGIFATLSANPARINQGQSSTLYWNSMNATSCTGVGFTAGGPSGNRSTGALNDLGTHNYLVFCSSGGQNSPPAVASVEVLNPNASIAYLSANPLRVNSGERSTITWTLSHVHSCSITKNKVAWKSGLSTTGSVADTITGPGEVTYIMSNCTDADGNVAPPSTVVVHLGLGLTEF